MSIQRSRRTTLGISLTTALGVIVSTGVSIGFGDNVGAALGATAFEIDGNLAVDGGQDWASDPATNLNLRGAPYETLDDCGGGDDSDMITPGNKLDDIDIHNPPVQSGSVHNKSDLCSVYQAWELAFIPEVGHVNPDAGEYQFIFYGGWRRADVNGEINVFFPLLGPDSTTQDDDLLIVYDFEDNSNDTSVDVLDWDGDSWEPTTLGDGNFEAETSHGEVNHPEDGLQTFGEFAINLTLAGILPSEGPCTSFTSGDPLTRTGNSASANLKDIVDAQPIVLTNCGSLTIVKETQPAAPNPAVPFEAFTEQADGNIAKHPGITEFSDTLTVPGTPSVTHHDILISPDYMTSEVTPLPSGWTQESVVCESVDPITGQAVTRTLYSNGGDGPNLSYPVAPATEAVCTISNVGPPSVSVTKTVEGTTTPWAFDFTISPIPAGDVATKTATDTAPTVSWDVLEADQEYTITEIPIDGYIGGTLNCGGDGDGTFTPVAGEAIQCSITNTELADVSVTKTVEGTTDDWSFKFTIDPVPAGEIPTKTATDTLPTVMWDGLTPGENYTITEEPVEDYESGIVDCDGDGTFAPAPGESVECAIINTELADVSVTKTVEGTTAEWEFDFTISPDPGDGDATKTATNAAPTVTWDGLTPGVDYTITETPVDGYLGGSVDCDGDGMFTPAPGESVDCTITNIELANVSVTKTVDGTTAEWAFDFTISPDPGDGDATKTATNAAPTVTWDGLTPGVDYTITETPVDGYLGGAVDCGDGATFAPEPGQSVDCDITNIELADVSVTKTVEGTSAEWAFDFTINPVPDGQDATKTATNAAPTVTWDGLTPGVDYTVTETPVDGYINGDVDCDGEGGSGFNPGPGESVDCNVTNSELAEVTITKFVIRGDAGWSFDMTISPVPDGEVATKAATEDAPTVGWEGLTPGVEYTITETPTEDYVNGAVDCGGEPSFTPAPGELVECTVLNQKPPPAVIPPVDIEVVKTSGAQTVLPGGPLPWTIEVTNNGPGTALEVVLTDDVPPELTLVSVSAPAGWDCSATVTGTPGKVSCSKPDMLPGETWTFVLNTTATGVTGGETITNVAVVTTTTTETTTENNTDSAQSVVETVVILPPTGGYVQTRLMIATLLLASGVAMVLLQQRRREEA